MAHTRRAVLGVAAASITLAGCVGDDGGGGDSPTTNGNSDTQTVDMRNTAFSPVRLEVPSGTTVVWENRDSFGHTIVDAQFHDSAVSWSYDSGNVPSGASAEYTFESAGVYEYFCDVHGRSNMCGVVLVGGASVDGDLPCEDGGGGMY